MRGDGDLYDYCVDDPINAVDPWGLSWAAPFQAALTGATLLAYGGARGAAYLADKLNGQGDKARREVDRVFGKHVVPINTGIAAAASGAAALEHAASVAPAAAAALGEGAREAAGIVKSKGLDVANAVLSRPETVNGAALGASDFITGYKIDGPYEPTPDGAAGFALSAVERGVVAAKNAVEGVSKNE